MNHMHATPLFAFQWAYDTPHYEEWFYVVIGIVVLGAIATVCAKVFNKPDRHYGYNEPQALFGELCHAHRLPWRQRWLLKKIARLNRLASPAEAFLRPDLFCQEKLPLALRAKLPQVQALANRLFE